jgi:mono/diheme cytochrome c family protein
LQTIKEEESEGSPMKNTFSSRRFVVSGCILFLFGCGLLACRESTASPPWVLGGRLSGWAFEGRDDRDGPQALAGTWYRFPGGPGGAPCMADGDVGGSWYWMRSPEQERVVVAGLFNRYCIRCHGVDGRGVWDIPGVPDFTNVRWQASRSDDQIARIIVEGRGAVMPTFRGALTLEEAWAMARYLRTFLPGTEISRPDFSQPEKKIHPNKETTQLKKGS